MLEDTNDKLDEAGFFLLKLARSCDGMIGDEVAAFPYYLSAFLTAARSVTFVLQAEEKDKYDAWFPKWLEGQSQENRDLLNSMKGQRNKVQKRGRTDALYSLQFVSIVNATPTEHRQSLAFQSFGSLGTMPFAVPRRVREFEVGSRRSDLLKACNEYFELVQKLVLEFKEHYVVPNQAIEPTR